MQRCCADGTTPGYPDGVTDTPAARRQRLLRSSGRRALVSAVGAALMVALAWAPSSGASSPPQRALHKAVERALAEHSAHVDLTMTISGTGTSLTLLRESGTQTFTSPDKARYTIQTLAGTTGKSTKLPVLVVGTKMYLQLDGTWYDVTASSVEAAQGITGSFESGNPAEAIGLLTQEGAAVTRLGRDKLDGTTMTKYKAVIDFDKKFKPPSGVHFSQRSLENFKKLTGTAKFPVDVWVDSAGIVRQERFTIPLSKSGLASMGLKGAPSGIELTMTVGLSDFGVAVTVKPPAGAKPLPTGSGAGTAPTS